MKLLGKLFPVGTRSLLYGAHAFWLHPWFVLAAWVRLYGWPRHPAIYLAILVHDWGYGGCSAMDDAKGEEHPILGAKIVRFFFGREWAHFTCYHSRFLAKRDDVRYSSLCVADKLATVLTPAWLYLPMVRATGEIREYMTLADQGKFASMHNDTTTARSWYRGMQAYLRDWVAEHKDLKVDTWTPEAA